MKCSCSPAATRRAQSTAMQIDRAAQLLFPSLVGVNLRNRAALHFSLRPRAKVNRQKADVVTGRQVSPDFNRMSVSATHKDKDVTSLHGVPLGSHPVSFRGQPLNASQHGFGVELSCFGNVHVRESRSLAQLEKAPARCYLRHLQSLRPFANMPSVLVASSQRARHRQLLLQLDYTRQDPTAVQLSAYLLQMHLLSYSTPLRLHECCFMIVRLGICRGSRSRRLSLTLSSLG